MQLARSQMYSLQLLLRINAVSLCFFFMPPLVQSGVIGTPEDECNMYTPDNFVNMTLALHNFYRAHVYPNAADMRKMYWSTELARMARERACQCTYNPRGAVYPYRGSYAVENLGLHFDSDITEIIYNWFQEGRNYDQCSIVGCSAPEHGSDYGCEQYAQMVWADAYEVGCAIANCPSLAELYHYYFLYNPSDDRDSDHPATAYVMVCVYGPGYPSNNIYNRPPYTRGAPCSQCPNQFSECEASSYHNSPPQYRRYVENHLQMATGAGVEGTLLGGLCYNRREAWIGSDPHFAIRLPGGSLLCYSFQGLVNSTFNLVHNDLLQMNALFVPDDTNYDNTWLGSIGITVRHDGKKVAALKFAGADQLVKIGERVRLDARTIEKLIFRSGELSLLEIPLERSPRYPRIHVSFEDSGVDFVVSFTKNNHLDLYWHNTGAPSKHSSGVVGQFFRDGVRIDEDSQVLIIPGRPPVPVEEQNLWKFTKTSLHGDTKCWTSAYHSSQGAGIVAGTYQDYIVEDLLSAVQ